MSRMCWMVCAAGLSLSIVGVRPVDAAEAPARLEYNRDIRPILSDKCFRCHGPDAGQRQGDLRLDQREAAIAARDGHRALSPGQPDQSELVHRVTSPDPADRMPPTDSGSELSAAEIERLKQWIEQGVRKTCIKGCRNCRDTC